MLTTVVREVGTGWLLAVVMTDNIGVGIQDRIEALWCLFLLVCAHI